jgi:hypothetical protein
MRFSEAIRKGCEMSDKAVGAVYMYTSNGKSRACALGAGKLAKIVEAGGCQSDIEGLTTSNIISEEPVLQLRGLPKELTSHSDIVDSIKESDRVGTVVYILNDKYGWSRKAIAEWLETVEDWYYTQQQQKEVEQQISFEETKQCLQDYTY